MKKLLLITIIFCLGFVACQKQAQPQQTQAQAPEPKQAQAEPKQEQMSEEELGQKIEQAVKNKELWIELLELTQKHQVEWCWVKGHDGNELNERADELARIGCCQAQMEK